MGTHPIFESDFDCLTEIGVFVKKYAWGNMAAWKPKSAGACTGIPTWSKSFASTLRGKQEENLDPKDSIADLEKLSFPVLYNQRYRQPPCQINQLKTVLKREEIKILDIKDLLGKLDSMLNTATNTEDILNTRNALHEKLTERLSKREILEKELCRLEHLKELNEEINDESDDIFDQIEQERNKQFLEYEHQKREDFEKLKNSPSPSEESHPSNTTPEPSRTPTTFNVNASEFKPSGKTNNGESGNYCLSAYSVHPEGSSSQKVTYHQPGYLLYPVVSSRPLSTIPTNNLVVLPQLYIGSPQ